MSGMMGGSDVSYYQGLDLDMSDPNSETHFDRNSMAESLSFWDDQENNVSKPWPLSPDPPTDPLPIRLLPFFYASLIDDEQNRYNSDIDCMNTSDEASFIWIMICYQCWFTWSLWLWITQSTRKLQRHVKYFHVNGHWRHFWIHGESTPTTYGKRRFQFLFQSTFVPATWTVFHSRTLSSRFHYVSFIIRSTQ